MCGERAGRDPPRAARRDDTEVRASLEEDGASSPPANERLRLTSIIWTSSSIGTSRSERLSRRKGALSSPEVGIEGSEEDGAGALKVGDTEGAAKGSCEAD
jgi:hypothetical protein